jgi:SAM-dependent methyltransferase
MLVMASLWATGSAQQRRPDVQFVPTPHHVVAEMLRLAEVKNTDVVYDLGCGDGRVVIAAAKEYGARGLGVDIDPWLIAESRANAAQAGVADRVKFVQQDLFDMDIREATVVTLYLLPQLNHRLRPKLLNDLRPGTRVLSHDFNMGDWYPDRTIRLPGSAYEHTIFYWVIPADVDGRWHIHIPPFTAERPYQLFLRQRFQEVSGSANPEGGEVPLTQTSLTGDHLRFTVVTSTRGGQVEMSFEGRVASDVMHGNVEVQSGPMAGRHEWTAFRAAAGTSPGPPR